MKYLGRRLARAFLLLLGVSALCFLFSEMAPGSFFDELRLNPQISPETIAALRVRYGLDQSLAVRYLRWMAAAARGDLGYSIAYNSPVAPLLWTRAKNTLLLTATATLLTWLIAVPLGVFSAASRGRLLDKAVAVGSSLLISIPEIVIAIALLALAVRTRLVPVGGMRSVSSEELSTWTAVKDVGQHMLLPTAVLVLASIAVVERHIRAAVVEVLQAPYIKTARGLGISRGRLLFRHVLPVAANPGISLFGFSLATLLSGSLLVEVVTGWPGLGPLLLDATLSRDLYLVIGGLMFSAVFMVAGNLIADLLLMASDPRIRAGEPDAN
ncbi:MAG: peptide/nickel transport system permease protein [Acidobacteriaceae bacterium]|jgi:peptide/nickel transport system permease protein